MWRVCPLHCQPTSVEQHRSDQEQLTRPVDVSSNWPSPFKFRCCAKVGTKGVEVWRGGVFIVLYGGHRCFRTDASSAETVMVGLGPHRRQVAGAPVRRGGLPSGKPASSIKKDISCCREFTAEVS
jgi:hypothetical protein